MDGVRARIVRDPYTDTVEIVLLERIDGKTRYYLRPDGDGRLVREELSASDGRRPPAALSFSADLGRDVLQSLAEQLAQLGFVQMNAAPQIGAMQAHLNDMREQSARLYNIAAARTSEPHR